MENLSIFDVLYEEYKIDKPIRLIELFAGYGSQALALKYLGANFEHWLICEWAMNSIIAYASIHRNELKNYGVDYTKELDKQTIAGMLEKYGVSLDYNKPATLDQLKRVKEDKLRLCLNSILWEHNYVDISRVKGQDLIVEETEKYTYLLTYSFPCQDLSLAGKCAGMEKGSGTRSGLLWEVERILTECKNKPQVLLMENVTQVHGENNNEHFKKWQLKLEELGYQSYWEDLSATEYGIPQTRNRTFMVSILGDYNYKFPNKTKLDLRLKDLLENNVDEKYYLSDKLLQCFLSDGTGAYPRKERFLQNIGRENQDIANSITTLAGNRATDNFIIGNQSLIDTLKNTNIKDLKDVNFIDTYNRKIKTDDKSLTITTRIDGSNNKFLLIKNATQKGYLEASEGDGVDISSRMQSHRGTVQKDKAQTITTMGGENIGVVVAAAQRGRENGQQIEISNREEANTITTVQKDSMVVIIGNYSPSGHNASRIIDTEGVAPIVMENYGTITAIIENKDEKK